MEDNLKTMQKSSNICHQPTLFVYANNKTNFQEEICVDGVVVNVDQIDKHRTLTSPTFYVQSLPFVITIDKKKATKKGNKSDMLFITLVVGEEIVGQWAAKFLVKFLSKLNENTTNEHQFEKQYEGELNNTNCRISHQIEWDKIEKLKEFNFNVNISAGFPNDGYEWPSHAATGYNGLHNEGATCYINSLLQSLFCTNEFRRIIYGVPVEAEDFNDSFIFWLKYIFYAMQFSGLPKITTNKMIRCFDWDGMTTTNQQDIQEFLRRLLDKVEQFVEGTEFKMRLSDLFVGTLQTTTKCKNVNYQTSKTETFWDIQLSIDETSDIHSAFEKYLDKLTISGFEYGDGAGRDDAWQEFEFISLPPILHIQLKRFKFNPNTYTLTKNNKRFEFCRKLDLSMYCSDAIYTLHSVLVHSGTANTGHYMAFICPKADDQWYKFNDEIVTKCSYEDAVDANYGNGVRSTNAYMLVYIKETCVEQTLRDVTEDEVVAKELIQIEMTKEIEVLSNEDRFYEVIVFTPETFMQTEKYKRGQRLFDPINAIKQSIFIEKTKSFADLLELLVKTFCVVGVESLAIWSVNINKDMIRFIDIDAQSDKLLKTLFKKDRTHLFVESLSMEEMRIYPFDKTKHVMIYFKEYDPSTKVLTFYGHRSFMLNQTVQNVQAYIRHQMDGIQNDEDIAILVESCADDEYTHRWLQPKQTLNKVANKNVDTYSAVVVFEILHENRRPKYLSCFFVKENNTSTENLEDAIHVSVKSDMNTENVLLSQKIRPDFKLSEIVQLISGLTSFEIQLLDAENNIIKPEFYLQTIQDFLANRNGNMRTRSQKQKGLVFLYKPIDSISPPLKEANNNFENETFGCGVPMEWETNHESIQFEKIALEDVQKSVIQLPDAVPEVKEIPVKFISLDNSFDSIEFECDRNEIMENILERFAEKIQKNINNLMFFNDKSAELEGLQFPLSIHLDVDKAYVEIMFEVCKRKKKIKQSTPVTPSANDSQRARQLYLTFEDRSGEHCKIDLSFDSDDHLSKAIDQIVDVMDLDRQNSLFFNSKSEQISELNTSVSEFLKSNSTQILYDIIDRESISMQYIDSHGMEIDKGMIRIPFADSTTIGQICSECQPKSGRVLRIKDGIIRGIVSPEVKLIDLIGDGYVYRLELYQRPYGLKDDTFYVCVCFVKKCPEIRLRTPLLVEVNNGDSLMLLRLRLSTIMGTDLKLMNDFEFEVVDDWLKQVSENGDFKLVKPNSPDIIPIITLNMNFSEHKKSRMDYSYNLPPDVQF